MGFMSDHGQEVILLSALMGSFAVALLCMTVIPEPWGRIIGGIAYFAVLFVVFLGGRYSAQITYGKFPHYHAIVLPSLEEFEIFADPAKTTFSTLRGGECGTISFGLAFKVDILNLGKKAQVIIRYKGKWFERTLLRSRSISMRGFVFDHPSSDIITLKQGGLFLDHGKETPTFELVTGSRDKESTYDLYTLEQKSVGAELATVSSEKQSQKNALLETKVSDLENQNADLLQQVNFLEGYSKQQKGILRGVMEDVANVKASALELIHPMYMREVTLDKLDKRLRGSKLPANFYLLIFGAFVAVLFIAYLWYHPEVIAGFQQQISNPIVVAGLVVFGIAVVFIVLRLRKRK